MCGIAGFVSPRAGYCAAELSAIAQSMARAIAHRGPDDSGDWVDARTGTALAHRRLSIIDLSPEGRQPMVSASGRFVTVFNGEIYNYPQLRAELEHAGHAPVWRGHSDTEVLLAAFDAWGVRDGIQRANGMFALAVVDQVARELWLLRDRMGEKPLYYGWQRESFLFGSELKALRAHPHFAGAMELSALPQYLRFGYVPSPLSMYAGIRKLPPGCLLRVALPGEPGSERLEAYWRVPLPAENPIGNEEALERLHGLLRDAIRSRMNSDVPLGAFLSGGIDSSTVVALMQEHASRPVRTYSIGFREEAHNEAVHARAVARVLGTEHTELYITAADALGVVPSLPDLYDEPFGDSSQIPTYLLSKLTRQHVTVALSGDGGDELFGGYARYIVGRQLLRLFRTVPRIWRQACAHTLRRVAGPRWDRLVALGPRNMQVLLSSDRLGKMAEVVALRSIRQVYDRLVSQWPQPSIAVPGIPEGRTALDDEEAASRIESPLSWMMYADQRTYLPDDILVKVDRASMAVSLEARVPLLDHRLVEFAAQLPLDLKVRNGQGKWLLRQVLDRYVDRKLVDRPKQGFAIPVAAWLRGPLREWAEEQLSYAALGESGVLDAKAIRAVWDAHLSGERNFQYPLWVLLMFQAWYRRSQPAIRPH